MSIERTPYQPTRDEWPDCFAMLCLHCARHHDCQTLERMLETLEGGPLPEGGWVTDPGSGVTCLSYQPVPRKQIEPERLLHLVDAYQAEPMCGGCAARKGSEASASLHTRRDFNAAVKNRSAFACHEDPQLTRPCSGWCRAVARQQKTQES